MKNYLIIGAIIAAIVFFMWKKRKKPVEVKSVNQMVTEEQDKSFPGEQSLNEQIVSALKQIADEFGIDTARKVEQMARLETGNFTSDGFLQTLGMGMEVPKRKLNSGFPFGWPSMEYYWNSINFIPQILDKRENHPQLGKGKGPIKHFIKFPNVKVGLTSLAHFVKNRKWEEWRALDPVLQSSYRNAVNKITPKIVNKISNNA